MLRHVVYVMTIGLVGTLVACSGETGERERGCATDDECKGDRVCEAGDCVESTASGEGGCSSGGCDDAADSTASAVSTVAAVGSTTSTGAPCVPTCNPDAMCGPDGCGGDCGTCSPNYECNDGACRLPDNACYGAPCGVWNGYDRGGCCQDAPYCQGIGDASCGTACVPEFEYCQTHADCCFPLRCTDISEPYAGQCNE